MHWRVWFDWYQFGSGISKDGEEVFFSSACVGKVLTLYPSGGSKLGVLVLAVPVVPDTWQHLARDELRKLA